MNNSFSEIPSLPHHPSPEVSDGLLMKETEQKVTTYFSGPADSNDFLAAKRIFEKNILGGTVAISFSNTPENIAQLLSYVQEQRNRPGSTPKGIVAKLIASGLFTEPTKEKKKKEIAEDFYSGKISFGGKADLTDEERALLEENLLKEPEKDFLEDDRAFEGMEETFNELYTSTSTIETLIRGEDLNYYLEFAEKELIDGGMEEVKKDFSTLQTKKEAIKKKEESYSPEERARNEKNKKAATLTERALVLGVSKAEWFGDNVKMSSISEYGDIRQGVDSLVEIVKNKEKSDFLGLGIDVTFRAVSRVKNSKINSSLF
jgi:hypothetical protein